MTAPTSLFKLSDVAAFRRDRVLNAAKTYAPKAVLADDYILEQLQIAEAHVQRRLGVFLSPRRIIPDTASAALVASAAAGPYPVVGDPGDDYDYELFNGNAFGFKALRHKPIISFNSMTFNYPGSADNTFTVPREWIRIDKKYGTINLLPAGTGTSLPLNAYLLSVWGGNRTAPLILQYDYVAGLSDIRGDYPDVLNIVKRQGVLNIIDNLFVPASGSISLDGLSQNLSVDCSKYQDSIDKTIDDARDRIVGIRMAFL